MKDTVEFGPEKMLELGENDRFIENAIKDIAETPRRPKETVLKTVFNTHVVGDSSMIRKYQSINS